MRAGVYTGGGQDLPQIGLAPLVHSIHTGYSCHGQGTQVHWRYTYIQYKHIKYRYTEDRLHEATP